MNQSKLARNDYFLFFIAMVMLLLYIYLYPQLFPEAALKLTLNESQLSQRANQILQDLGFDTSDFTHRLELHQKQDQIRYLQKKFGLKETIAIIKDKAIPVYFWKVDLRNATSPSGDLRISYDSEEEARTAIEKALSDTITMSFTLDGQLISFDIQMEKKDLPDSLSFDEALSFATALLKKFKPDQYSNYTLTESNDKNKRTRLEYDFAWANSELVKGEKESIKMIIVGQKIKQYQVSFTPPKEIKITSHYSEIRSIPQVLSFIAIFIIFVFILIKKLRKDEIDLRNNVLLSILISIAFIYIIANDIDRGEGNIIFMVLVPVLVATPFIFFAFLGMSSISESEARDVWEEKLFTFDALRKGTVLFPQFSLAIWRGLALAFIAAGGFALVLKIVSWKLNPFMTFSSGNLTKQISFVPAAWAIASGLLITGFGEFIFRLFFVSALRKKLSKAITIILLCSLFWTISFVGGYSQMNISPYLLNQAINFLLGILFAAFLFRWDFVTVWWGAFVYFMLRDLYPITFYDHGFLMWNGISFWILVLILIVVTVIGYRKKVDIQELKKYVPLYLTRRAERERILRELEIARRVQLSFLPQHKPKIKNIDIASICIPATEVGGDYYDYIELDDHRLGIVIGDVSDKGISAAFHMTLTKGFLKSQAKSNLSPREIMINLNELFYENVERGTFISMIYAIFDLAQRTLTFARAGHNPIILQKGHTEKVEVLCPRGLALGLTKGTTFEHGIEEYKIGIQAGDIFVFYTDGFSEAMNSHKEEFGEERLQDIVKEIASSKAEVILNTIRSEIVTFVGDAPQHDDMTMLVVKIL